MPEGEVLKRALAALVADWAVEGMVGQLELEDVGASRHRHRALRPHDHALGHGRRARRLRARWSGREVDEAQPASADRIELVVIAEDRDLDADGLGGFDDERAGGHRDLVPIDGQVDVRHWR